MKGVKGVKGGEGGGEGMGGSSFILQRVIVSRCDGSLMDGCSDSHNST